MFSFREKVQTGHNRRSMENLVCTKGSLFIDAFIHYSGWKIASVLAEKGRSRFLPLPFLMFNFLESLYLQDHSRHTPATDNAQRTQTQLTLCSSLGGMERQSPGIPVVSTIP